MLHSSELECCGAWSAIGKTAQLLRDSSRHLLHMSKSHDGQFHENHSP